MSCALLSLSWLGWLSYLVLTKQFRMRTQSQNANLFFRLINPNEQKISFYMTFHTSFIISLQHMRVIFIGYRNLIT